MATESSEILEPHPVDSGLDSEHASARGEIDTSAPFESVKEAANRFGGMGFWKPISHKPSEYPSEHDREVVDVVKLEEQAAQLERDLITKERETLDVLKELETTKNIVEELKLKLQKEASEINAALKANSHSNNVNFVAEVSEEGKHERDKTVHQNGNGGLDLCPSAAPGFILLELKQAKLNLTRTTNDLADIRATVDLYNKKIEKERVSLEKTRQRLSSSTSKISCLEEELNQTRQKLEQVKDTEVQGNSQDPLNITRELQKLKIKALSNSENKSSASQAKSEDVTLTYEEYSSLISKAREAEQACKDRVGAMLEVDEANVLKTEILKKVEEATEEVKISKKALEEALSRVETANTGKLAVEEALRMWRSEHGHKRRTVHNSTKFKNSHSSAPRKESRLLDVNGLNLVNDELKPVLKPTLSIGQILSRKLLLSEEYENGMQTEKVMGKRKVSLGQMLSKPSADPHSAKRSGKENNELPAKRKKFGFARISLLVAKQSKKKKNLTASSMCRST
ncbi:hypothetical protein Pfo_029059 [Paulownia fortunei]|nr:hypothetical protein Pfo_029059 [Paulownia fortunei]